MLAQDTSESGRQSAYSIYPQLMKMLADASSYCSCEITYITDTKLTIYTPLFMSTPSLSNIFNNNQHFTNADKTSVELFVTVDTRCDSRLGYLTFTGLDPSNLLAPDHTVC